MKRILEIVLTICFVAFCPSFQTTIFAQTSDSILSRKLLDEKAIQTTSGNSVRFFYKGDQKFEDLFAEIRKAKKFVHLEYFNFRNDSIAGLLFQLLGEKVKEGVEVRAIYDAFGNMSNNRPISRHMEDSINATGIRLVKFRPIKFPWLNHYLPRDHRKIVVIDGRVAYTGGMNVADYYINGIPDVGTWYDLHMHIEGPAVNKLHDVFAQLWQRITGEVIEGEKYFPRQDNNAGPARMAIVDKMLGKTRAAIRDLFVDMLNGAQKSVKIINPYFVPTHRVRQALKDAVDRGVDVQIILSAKSDEPVTPEATHYIGNNLAKRGAKVFMFEGGFHHTKMMIIDDIYATVGSSNMDARSLRCDYEINTVIFDRGATDWLINHFEKQKESCFQIEKGYWKTRSVGKRFEGWFGNLLTPVM